MVRLDKSLNTAQSVPCFHVCSIWQKLQVSLCEDSAMTIGLPKGGTFRAHSLVLRETKFCLLLI